MIKRTLTIKVQGNRCVCDAPLYLHTQDKNIHVVINVTNTKFEIKNNMLLSFTLIKPNGDEVDKSDCYIDKGQCHLLFSGEDFDEETEVGTHLVQLKLYDEDRQSRINIPPFAMHVLKSSGSFYADEEIEGILAEQNAYKLMTENKLALEMSQSVLISDLPTTTEIKGYAPVTQGDTTYKLDMANVASKNYVDTEIAKAQLSGGGGSGEIDLSGYATKDDLKSGLATKAEVEHEHEQYLTEHQDLSNYATKENLASGLTTKANKEHRHVFADILDLTVLGDSEGETYIAIGSNFGIGDVGYVGIYLLKNVMIGEDYYKEDMVQVEVYEEFQIRVYSSRGSQLYVMSLEDGTFTKVGEPQIFVESDKWNEIQTKIDDLDIPTVPTKTSELENDSGFITANDIPEFDTSDLATKQELSDGLATKANVSHTHDQYLTEHQDLSDYALKTELPTKVSELTNDSGYLTAIPSEYVTETELDAKGYLTEHQNISGLATKQELSDGLDTKSDTTHNHDTVYAPTIHEHSQYLTEHQDISNLATKEELTNGLATKAEATHTHTASEVSGLATIATSGNYNDLSNTPEIPTTLPANGGNADTVGGYTIWVGTLVEYDALSYKNANTVYMIKEE